MIYMLPIIMNNARGLCLIRPICGLKGAVKTSASGASCIMIVGSRQLGCPFLHWSCLGNLPISTSIISKNNMETQEPYKPFYKGKKFIWSVVIGFILIGMIFGDDTSPVPAPSAETATTPVIVPKETEVQKQAARAEAQEQLDALIALSKQANIVASYEFSEIANVVYVTNVWYGLDVSFKKDLMGKIASLKEAATGYHRFEVRNSKSNEKVAEVTAFSGSIEIYK